MTILWTRLWSVDSSNSLSKPLFVRWSSSTSAYNHIYLQALICYVKENLSFLKDSKFRRLQFSKLAHTTKQGKNIDWLVNPRLVQIRITWRIYLSEAWYGVADVSVHTVLVPNLSMTAPPILLFLCVGKKLRFQFYRQITLILNERMADDFIYIYIYIYIYTHTHTHTHTVGYATANVIGSRTSFVIASVRSSIHWNYMYLGAIRSRPTAYSKVAIKKYECKNNIKLIYLSFMHCTCKFEKHKQSFLKLALIKSMNNLTHMKSINNLSLVKTIIELSIINNIPPRSLQHLCSL